MGPLERRIAAWAAALATAVAVAGGGRVQGADPPGAAAVPGDAAARCDTLRHLSLPDTAITSATVVPASGAVPEYCQVQGGLETVILFEVALPTTTWNGKLLYVGGGGYNGTVPDLRHGLARGYAAAGTDTGHRGDHWDASALYEDPHAQINYAHRGAHLVTELAKQIVQAYYGTPERHSFFLGCSNGGKMGLMAVQRYPADFDGVVVGGAVVDRTALMMMFQWTQRALVGAEIPPSKIPAMERATGAACDARDGLQDGVIDRPDRCAFDPKVLTCRGADGPDCLTPAQAAAWTKILQGPTSAAGEPLYPGYSPGHEDDYPAYVTGLGVMHGYPSSNFMYMDNFMRWFAFGPRFDSVRQFDYETHAPAVRQFAKEQDAAATDLSAFRSRGGKLIIWNGWADHSTPPLRAIAYHGDVRKAHGAATNDFVRLFMVPGMHHCSGGAGPNVFGSRGQYVRNDADHDVMAAVDRWVETGVAPDRIVATKFVGDDPARGVARTRPLCPYPQIAKYAGSGSIDEAANFVCAQEGPP